MKQSNCCGVARSAFGKVARNSTRVKPGPTRISYAVCSVSTQSNTAKLSTILQLASIRPETSARKEAAPLVRRKSAIGLVVLTMRLVRRTKRANLGRKLSRSRVWQKEAGVGGVRLRWRAVRSVIIRLWRNRDLARRRMSKRRFTNWSMQATLLCSRPTTPMTPRHHPASARHHAVARQRRITSPDLAMPAWMKRRELVKNSSPRLYHRPTISAQSSRWTNSACHEMSYHRRADHRF